MATLVCLFLSLTARAQIIEECLPARTVKVTVQSSPFPSTPGQTVTFAVFVEPVMGTIEPSGDVQILDGSIDLGLYPLKQAQVRVSRVFNEAGARTITAIYGGDFSYCANLTTFGQAVERITSAISLASSTATSTVGEAVTLTAQLGTPVPAGVAPPSGQIQFVEGSTVLGSVAPVSGKATLTLATLPGGTHQITAVLVGDPNWFSVRSAPVTQTVNRAPTTTALTATFTLTEAGMLPTFTAAVAATAAGSLVPGGTVQFVDITTSAVLFDVPLPAGSGTVSVASARVPATNRPITALYSGDANFSPSTSNTIDIPGLINATGAASSRFAPDELVSLFLPGLATTTLQGSTVPLPTSLGGDTVTVTDSDGVARPAGLYLVSPGQINFVIPAATAPGAALIAVASGSTRLVQVRVTIGAVAPGLFSAGSTGRGPAAAQIQRDQVVENANTPIRLGTDPVFLILYGTGVRNRTALAAVTCNIGGRNATVFYAGAQSSFPGLDQINVLLPPALSGAGTVDVTVTVDGQTSNTVTLTFQ